MSKWKLSFLFVVLCTFVWGQTYKIERVEPRNWWVDMKHSAVQVMIYGKNIADLDMVADGLPVVGVTKTENKNYVFVTLETKNQSAGVYPIRFSRKGKVLASCSFEVKQRQPNSAEREGFSTKDVVYLLMPDRFANGELANDSHASTTEKANRQLPGGRHGGDIRGIINQLDYLSDLGATAIWSTPLFEDNDSTYSYHTYGQSDLYRVDPRYGTEADFNELITKMHERGMKFILDVVPNHWGSNHWMLKDLPTYNWVHQFPGYGQTNYRMSTQTDPYTSQLDKELCEDGWFVRSMPDLNQRNPLVLTYLIQNTIWWIENSNIDGLRVDTYSYNSKEEIADWTKALRTEYPNMNIVGEVWMHDQALQSYWQENSPVGAIQSYNSHLPSVMDFTLHDAFGLAFLENEQGWDKGMIRFYENFANDFLYANPNNILVFSENHDTQRFNQLYPDLSSYKMMLTLLTTCRGIPQVYYGSEIGMAGDKSKGDADIRKDFPGGWQGDAQNAFTKQGRTSEQEAYHAFTKKLLNWRKSAEVVHDGKTIQFIPEKNVYVYFRVLDKKAVMVIINNSSNQEELKLARFNEVIQPFTSAKDITTDRSFDLKKDSWSIAPKSAHILELNVN
jgi:glycosidase